MVPAIEEEGRVARVVEHGWWEVQQKDKQLLYVREEGKGGDRERLIERVEACEKAASTYIASSHFILTLPVQKPPLTHDIAMECATYNTD